MNQETITAVRQISKSTIKPHTVSEESKQPHYLTPWDLSFFNAQYIQKGLLFRKPLPSPEDPNPTITFINQLKQSLSMTLTHYYPLAGRMVTKKQDNPPFYGIYIDCSNDSVGAEFIHAAADITMLDILTPIDVPRIVQSFFALEGAICHDGHIEPLLVVQGLLFRKPSPSFQDPNPTITFIDQLKHSLSMTLTHFYPLSGRMVTKQQDNPPFYGIYVDCSNDSVGADFVHAAVDISMLDILTPIDVPLIATELLDGIFVGCTFNHVIGDGTAYWKFFNAFAEICRKIRKASKQAGDQQIEFNISCPPITRRWFMEDDIDPALISLPFSHHREFVVYRYERPFLRERMFHFTEESLAKLKAIANEECSTKHTPQISSFQALTAFVWRSITRSRHLTSNQKTSCRLAIDDRLRLNPPLSDNYFGNWIQSVCGTTTVGELLEHGIGWAALIVHKIIKEHTDEKIRGLREQWMKKPLIHQTEPFFSVPIVHMGSSPRFDVYGCDFGLGTPVAARSGFANKFDGKVTSYRGLTGTGSVMLEVCLPPESMSALESDQEFMDVVSPHEIHMQHLAYV
ncbi:hypothetical protein C5167_010596 [Papaver somniferum]|uniref:Uncharacterized protein n=1 Tax=Papaver somniferum TaxID=3469 RepID=A0A4Y7K4I7_PAPSO|nr:hypothetical protein C5167_010596 [Papaver somniferum]